MLAVEGIAHSKVQRVWEQQGEEYHHNEVRQPQCPLHSAQPWVLARHAPGGSLGVTMG